MIDGWKRRKWRKIDWSSWRKLLFNHSLFEFMNSVKLAVYCIFGSQISWLSPLPRGFGLVWFGGCKVRTKQKTDWTHLWMENAVQGIRIKQGRGRGQKFDKNHIFGVFSLSVILLWFSIIKGWILPSRNWCWSTRLGDHTWNLENSK